MDDLKRQGDPIRLRECIEVHLRTGEILKAAVPQGLQRFIVTESVENQAIGVSYMRGTGGGNIFYGFYTHLMQDRDWTQYNQQHPTEQLVSNRHFSTAFADNDNILRERLETMVNRED